MATKAQFELTTAIAVGGSLDLAAAILRITVPDLLRRMIEVDKANEERRVRTDVRGQVSGQADKCPGR